MAGGPSTPALTAAVSRAGGLGFLAAGYKTVDQVERELAEVGSLVSADLPYGLNLSRRPAMGRVRPKSVRMPTVCERRPRSTAWTWAVCLLVAPRPPSWAPRSCSAQKLERYPLTGT